MGTVQERVDRLVREETIAMVVRMVAKMAPAATEEEIAKAARAVIGEMGEMPTMTAEEALGAIGFTDAEIRAQWRNAYEGELVRMFAAAGALPS